MRDIIELANSVDRNLPEMKRREKFCDLLLEEAKTLKGRDLAYYLSECVIDLVVPGVRLTLKFPTGTHIFDPPGGKGKTDGGAHGERNGSVEKKL